MLIPGKRGVENTVPKWWLLCFRGIRRPVQQRHAHVCVAIPRGEVRTYTDIAIQIGHPSSARAVANACGKNPCAPEVPCHRVIRSDGSIGGYSAEGGSEKKRAMLREEGVHID